MTPILAVAVLGVGCSLPMSTAWAQPAPATPAPSGNPRLEKINEGELRLDGKIVLIASNSSWQIEALSWTSPRGVTTSFTEPRPKIVVLSADTLIHPRGEEEPVPRAEIKVGNRVAVIGRNLANGSLAAREVIMLEGFGRRRTVGQVPAHPLVSDLVRQSRQARERDELERAYELLTRAISTAQGLRDLTGEGLAQQDLGLLHLDRRELDRALTAFNRVISIGEGAGSGTLLTLGLLGSGQLLGNRPDTRVEGQTRLERARSVSLNQESRLRVSVLGALARAYLADDRLEDAMGVIASIPPIEDAAGDPDGATETLFQLAILHALSGQNTAREVLNRARTRTNSVRRPEKLPGMVAMEGVTLMLLGDGEGANQRIGDAATRLRAQGRLREAEFAGTLLQRVREAGSNPLAVLSALNPTTRSEPPTGN